MDIIVGIDLGTTNSEIAYIKDDQPYIIADETGDMILPSVVGLSEDGRLLVGHAARNQLLLAPERSVKSIKRHMGEDTTVTLGEQAYTPQEISAMILRTLRERAERHLGTAVSKAVITVPAYFNDAQRQATREAGELAGLEVVRIINEPTAASLTYDTDQWDLKRLLVYDLGGGTFDVSIVQVQEGVVEVLSSHGDTQLGGDDFDALLAEHIMQQFENEQQFDLREVPAAKARVLRAAEEAKKQLSVAPFTDIQEEYIAEKEGTPLHLTMEIARHEFDDLVRPLLDKTITCVGQALDDAKLNPAQLDRVLLVGGSTRSPIVTEMLEERLNQPAHQEVDPDLCVALGAGVQAAIINGQDIGPVLVDITPHSLGIRCLGTVDGLLTDSMFSRIITRNSPLPISRSEGYQTVVDSQETVDIEIYQGEHEDARMNTLVGEFMVEGLAPVPAGNEVLVHMNLTLDGILQVTATEKQTGLQRQVRIENALTRFQHDARDEAQRRLDALFEDSDDTALDTEFRSIDASEPSAVSDDTAMSHIMVPAQALIEKAERLLPNVDDDVKADLDALLTQLRDAMNARDMSGIKTRSDELSDLLFYLEDV
ncbi:MAG: heat shock protein Hsp70 [Candidatus Entotheonella factor]|uniref:Heat shock protein Hsp70 n=1 Tax=Entotheonella factor TaxID=1429438 RepID=W4LTU0_ENTF1|nr:MAG: heat shock protein Hsp70 [Candidatus Entotheonella factor]